MHNTQPTNFWKQFVLIAWLLALLIICARSTLTPQRNSVVGIYRQAAGNWLTGEPLYESADAGQDRFRYSPLAATLLTPLYFLPERPANVLWRLLNASIFLAGFSWWLGGGAATRVRGFLPPGQARRLAGIPWYFLLILPLAIPSLNNGQVNPLLMGLILAGIGAVRNKLFVLAGALLALACWIKVYPLAIALLLLLLYPRRFSLPFFLFAAIGFVLPFLFQSPGFVISQYSEWLSYLRTDDRQLLSIANSLRDVRLLFRVWLVPLSAEAFLAIQILVAVVIAFLCLRCKRQHAPEKELLLLTTHLGCCWMTVFGPSTESATWIVLAPSLTLLMLKSSYARWLRSVLVCCYVLFLLTSAAMWFPWGKHFAALGPQPLAGLVVFGLAIVGTVMANKPARRPLPILPRYRSASLITRLFLHLRKLQTPYESIAARLPSEGLILDLGCGHGLLSLTLAMQSPARHVLGVDHDDGRIRVAKVVSEDLENVEFSRGDFASLPVPNAGRPAGIVVLDALHYLDYDAQEVLLGKVRDRLNSDGVLLIREVDTDSGLLSWSNRQHERMMTGLGFTQAEKLHFRKPNEWIMLLRQMGFDVETEPSRFFLFADRFFVCRKPPLAASVG